MWPLSAPLGALGGKIENEGINVLKAKVSMSSTNSVTANSTCLRCFWFSISRLSAHRSGLVDDLYRFLRRALHRRVTWFNDMRALLP